MTRTSLIPIGLLVAVAVGVAPAASVASTVTLLLPGNLPTGVELLSYYNGGLDSHNDGPGPSDGITFTSPVEQLTIGQANGHDKAENAPSNGVFYSAYSASTAGVLNDASGFSTLSLEYSLLQSTTNPNGSLYAGTIYLYSGLNGTGAQVGSIALTAPASPTACTATGTPSDEFCTWQTASPTLTGIAESLVFSTPGSTKNEGQEFDNIQLTPVPLPAAAWLMLSGLAGLGLLLTRADARVGPYARAA
jgi:hypothetical protein